MRNKLLYPLLVLLALPFSAFGQGSRYVPVPFNDDLEAVLKQQLGRAAEIDALLNVLKKLDPSLLKKFDIDPDSVQLKPGGSEITSSDPKLADKLKQLLNQMPVKLSPDEQKAAERTAERIRAGQPSPPTPKKVEPRRFPKIPERRQLPAPVPKKDEELNRATRDFMKDLERSPVGEVLRNSRAWQRGLEELQRGSTSSGNGSLSFLERWTGKLRFPEGLKLDISESLLSKLRNLNAPSLPSVNVRMPRVGGFNRLPSVNLPGLPGATAIPWEGVLVVGVILAAAALLWQVLVKGPKRGDKAGQAWRLGPWPVQPGKVSTPREFIQAFEHLALLRLGLPARNWHHRRIAEGLEVDDTAAPAARRLMHLYEEVRYAPTAVWSNATLVTARRDLCLLAGVPAA